MMEEKENATQSGSDPEHGRRDSGDQDAARGTREPETEPETEETNDAPTICDNCETPLDVETKTCPTCVDVKA